MSSRRNLLLGSAGLGAVIASRQARAVTAPGCTAVSGFSSVAAFNSHHPNQTAQCTAYNIEYWQSALLSQNTWSSRTVASALGSTSSQYNGSPLGDIIRTFPVARSGELGVLQHLVAMLLSIEKTGYSGAGFNAKYLSGVWQNYKANGAYVLPANGLSWSSDQLITWLRVLMYPTL